MVDGVPVIDKSKLDKLLAKISKEFSRKGAPLKVDDVFVPWDDLKDKSKGCVQSRCTAQTIWIHCFLKIYFCRVPDC